MKSISHDLAEETLEAKARWFQSLTLAERMDMLCWFTDMVMSANPGIVEQKRAEPIAGRILVLTQTQGEVPDHRGHRRRSARRAESDV
ncbi:MAG: hypothetical protein ACUVWR_16055 [Anaerolineae bacterium]